MDRRWGGRRRRRAGPRRRRSASPDRRPIGSRAPATGAGGPRPDRVSVLREPEDGSDVEAAAHGEVAPQRPGGRLDGDDVVAARPCAARGRPTWRRSPARTSATSQPTERLEHGRIRRVADEPVEQLPQRLVQRTRRRHADGARSRAGRRPARSSPSPPSGRAARSRLAGRVSTTNRTVVPGAINAGGSRSASQSRASVCPSRCQPPGDALGYTAAYVSAMATAPAGTRVRGVGRRGRCSAGSRPRR